MLKILRGAYRSLAPSFYTFQRRFPNDNSMGINNQCGATGHRKLPDSDGRRAEASSNGMLLFFTLGTRGFCDVAK